MVVKSADPPPRLSDAMFHNVVCNPPPYGVDHVPCPVPGCDAVAPLLQTRTPWDSDAEGPEGLFGPSTESTPRRAGPQAGHGVELEGLEGLPTGTVTGPGIMTAAPESSDTLAASASDSLPVAGSQAASALRSPGRAAGSGPAPGSLRQPGPSGQAQAVTALSPTSGSLTKKTAGQTAAAAGGPASGYVSGYASGYASVGGSSVTGGSVRGSPPATIRDMPVFAPRAGTKKANLNAVRVGCFKKTFFAFLSSSHFQVKPTHKLSPCKTLVLIGGLAAWAVPVPSES
jgi:hypothetical protein